MLVGSQNPVKVAATREAFSLYFEGVEVLPLAVDSEVPAQPINEQTFRGARRRARAVRSLDRARRLGGAFCVGIEGGVIQLDGRWFAFGAVCVLDARGRMGQGTSPLFELPPSVVQPLLGGAELGAVIDRLSGRRNTKQKSGAIGYFTRGRLDRQALYVQGLSVALIPFLRPRLFFEV